MIDGIFSVLHCLWDFVITFIDFFLGIGTTNRLAHLPAYVYNPSPSKNSLHALINICIWILSSVISTRSSAKAMQHNSSSPTFVPTFNFLSFSSSSSMVSLNSNGDSEHPCFTTALILICLVTFPPVEILVIAPLYISITVFLSCSAIPFLCKPFSMLLWETVLKALAKSITSGYIYFLLFFCCCLIVSWRIFTFSKHPSTGTNPFCHLSSVMFNHNLLSHNYVQSHE